MRLIAFCCLLLTSQIASAAYNTLQSTIVFNANGTSTSYGGGANVDGLPSVNNSLIARLLANSTFSINASSLRVQANGGGTTCSGTFYYRCYRQGATAPVFSAINLTGPNNIAPSVFLWSSNTSVNLMNSFTTPGVYVVECYWNSTGNASNNSCTTTFNDNNAGNNYKGYVEYCMTDAFTDGNFSSGPAWTGDVSDFLIVNTSDVSATDAIASQTLRLNAPLANGTRYLSKPESNWNTSQTWSFWIGRRAQSYNIANNVAIWLYANEANLESATVDGYRLFVGDNSGADEIRLQSVTNNVATNLITSATGVANNRTDVGFNVVVRRSSAGVWTIHTSTLPTTNSSGQSANSDAFTTSTVLQGTNTNNAYALSGLGYMGVVINHTNTANAARAFEMDNFYFTGGPAIQCPTMPNALVDSGCGMTIPNVTAGATLINDSFMAYPIVITQSPAAGTAVFGTGTTTITLTATDARNNTGSCQVSINRIDQIAPTINCPSNISVNSDAASCGAIVNYTINASDNCLSCAPTSLTGYTLIGSLNGHTYFRSNASFTWAAANSAANTLGGHMATLASATESAFLNGIGTHWIGLSDDAIEGQWSWVTGEPLIYTQWAAGEPNNSGNQDYGVVNFAGNNWDDDGSWASRPYVLEFDCITMTQTQGLPSGALFPIGTTNNSYTFTDASGNTSVCSFNVTVIDNTAPTLTCPANLTINAAANACSAVVNYNLPTATDNCGNCTTAAPMTGFTALGTLNGKAYYLSNNTATYAAAASAAQASGGHLLTIANASENSFVANAVLNIGNNIWYWIGLDDAANEGVFVWSTGEALSYTNWSAGEPNNSGLNEDHAHVWNNGIWNDINGTNNLRFVVEKPCIVPQLTQGLASGSSFPVGTTVVNYAATDQSGNTGTCSFNIQVNDVTPPTVNCPGNQSVVLTNNCTTLMLDYRSLVNATDNCTASNNLTISQSPAPNSLLNGAGTIVVSITATDQSGNASTCTFNLQKQDNSAPIITVPANIVVNAPANLCGAVVTFTAPSVTDNCSNCNIGAAITGFTYLGASGTVGYYISNTSANFSTAQANCMAAGGYIASIGSALENSFIRSAANTLGIGSYGIGLSDQNTEGTWTWINGEVVAYTNWNGGEPNNSGNEDFVQVYPNGLWNDIASNQFYILEKPCLNLTQTAGLPSGSSFPIGTTTNTYSAIDASGNVGTNSFQITVIDNTIPVMSCPTNITVTAPSGSCSATVNYATVTATDNCGNCTSPAAISGFTLLGTFNGSAYYLSNTTAATGAIASTNCTNQGGFLAAIGSSAENQFIRNAATALGNATYLIGYSDALIEGVFQWTNGQANTYTNWNAGEPNNSGNEDYTQVLTNGVWNDIAGVNFFYVMERTCLPVTRTAGLASGSSFPVGTTTVTHSATDASGNNGVCSFTVTVNETTPPTIICPSTQTLNLQSGCSNTLPNYTSLASATDNCTNSNLIQWSQSPAAGSLVAGIGTMSIQLMATDLSGNTSTCSFTLNKVDTNAPSITCPANQTLYVNNDCQAQLPNYASQVILSDNCYSSGQLSLSQTPAPGFFINGVGSQTVTMTVTDGNGNSSNCTFNVAVLDTIAPQVVCPVAQTLILDINNNVLMPDLSLLSSATDNCSSTLTWSQTPTTGTVLSGTSNFVATLQVADASNEQATCLVNINTVPIATEVSFVQSEWTEMESSGTVLIPLSISHPSSTNATSVQVMATGNLALINNQSSFTVNFPAGTSANQNLSISIINNSTCSDDEMIQFTIQSVSGGNSAIVGAIDQQDLHVWDDEHVRPVRLNSDFEAGIGSNWLLSNNTDWAITTTNPIAGLQSIQHQVTGTNGQSWFTNDSDNRSLLGVETTWTIQLDNMAQEPSPANYFIYYLSADNSDLSQGINGYAVGVRPATTSSPDFLTLWRVQSGNVFVPLVTSGIDVGVTHSRLGIQVTRDENGLWTLMIDQDGGFNNLVTIGSQLDVTNHEILYSGLYYRFNSAAGSMIKVDDISIRQKACSQTYYSQGSGNANAAIWAQQPVATPITALPSAYNNFIIQSGHAVDLNAHFASNNLTIQNGGTLNAAEKKVYVYGDMVLEGNYSSSDGYLVFKGEINQQLVANAAINLNHVVIDNDDHIVHFPSNVNTNIQQNKVLCIAEGTLNTHDNLVLKSSSIGTASIGEITSAGALTGRVTMERHIPSLNNYPYGSWVAVGCAVQGISLHDWNDDMITTGFVGSDYPPPYSFTNIQYYNESAAGAASNGFMGVTNINDSLKFKQGYFVYMQTPTQFLDVTGVIQQHDFVQPLSYTNTGHADDGWNLMVNQYPSEIDFRQMALNSSGVASYYLYDAESANYKVYNGWANVGTAPQRVAMNQSFFVQAAGPGAYLQYSEKYKTNQGTSWERTLPETGYATFQMNGPTGNDACILYLNPESNGQYEYTMDARKLMSANPDAVEIALVSSDNTLLTIDARNPNAIEAEIALYCEMPQVGTYTFLIDEWVDMPFGTCYVIEDIVSGEIMPLHAGASWSITISEPYVGNRFIIHTQNQAVLVVHDVTCPNQENGSIEITNAQHDWISILNVSNQTTVESSNGTTYSNLPAGEYLITINALELGCEPQLIGIQITEPEFEDAVILAYEVATCNQENNGSVSVYWSEMAPFQFELRNEYNAVMQTGTAESEIVEWTDLAAGSYTIRLWTSCTEQVLHVDVTDPDAVMVGIMSDNINITVENGMAEQAVIYQNNINALETDWILNSEWLQSGSVFEHPFYAPGAYELILLAHNERCSATDTIHIEVEQVSPVQESLSGGIVISQYDSQIAIMAKELTSPIERIDIFDMNGQLVFTESIRIQSGLHSIQKGNWSTGIYSLVLYSNNLPEIHKLFISQNK